MCSSNRSLSVLFPWSMCATMQKFLYRSIGIAAIRASISAGDGLVCDAKARRAIDQSRWACPTPTERKARQCPFHARAALLTVNIYLYAYAGNICVKIKNCCMVGVSKSLAVRGPGCLNVDLPVARASINISRGSR